MHRLHDTFFKIQEALLHPCMTRVASQNSVPAATHKGVEPSGGAAQGPVGKRLQQELMTFMMSVTQEFLPSLNQTTFTNGAPGSVYEDLRYTLSPEFARGYPYSAPTR